MIKKRALFVEVWCTSISLNFYLFQNNFASLRDPKWIIFRLKWFLLDILNAAPRNWLCSIDTPLCTQRGEIERMFSSSFRCGSGLRFGWLETVVRAPRHAWTFRKNEYPVSLISFTTARLLLSLQPITAANAFLGVETPKVRKAAVCDEIQRAVLKALNKESVPWLTRVHQVGWRFGRAPKNFQTEANWDEPQQGKQERMPQILRHLFL